ncbi:MAG: bifunctional glutamate N-acetyltransferase/amino-acid acetyltransferase ArgJ [Gammaproteobacteria bacterium]
MEHLIPNVAPASIAGVRLATAAAGVRKAGRVDLCLIEIAPGARVAGVFTRNVFCAAPVTIARRHLDEGTPRLLVINSGNANAGTGQQGFTDAMDVCAAAGRLLGCDATAVLPFSTGVIGQRLPAERIVSVLPQAIGALEESAWESAARAIMTTDTVPKWASADVSTSLGTFKVTGIAKGAGMIKPNMATLLAYVATDAPIPSDELRSLVARVADRSFNRITIDGDTSTNDSFVLIATGDTRQTPLTESHPAWPDVVAAVDYVCRELARAIVGDGEGATKLVAVKVSGGRSENDCLKAAYAVAESPLVKTALFASDPNWGRILAAVGRSGVTELRMEDIRIALDDYAVIEGGEPVADYDETISARIMAKREFDIRIQIGRGPASAEVLTCDFSFDYVKINAEYRT